MEGNHRTRRRRQKKGTRANDVRKTSISPDVNHLIDRMSPDVTGRMIDRTSSTDVNRQLIDRTSTDGQMNDRASTDGQMNDRASTDGQMNDRASTDGQMNDRASMLSSVTAAVSSLSLSSGGGGGLRRLAVVSGPSPSRAGLSLPGVMDAEGRVDESRLRMHIFKNGGVSPACQRGAVWRFLFGMYACSSTAQERPLVEEQLAVRYGAMKRRWQRALPSSVCLRLNGTDAELVSAVRYFDERQASEARRLQAHHDQNAEVRDRLAFLELQAQVLLERVTFDLEEVQEAIRIIDKDVPRTNRDLDYYLGEGSGNLLVLRDILITYAAFHPEVSYAQGMNDLCSRFLEVLDCEVDTFWSFSCYMDKFSKDFRADGLHRKIELEAALLKQLDPQLHNHLVTDSMESLTFCHRWLLLGFQREFEPGDALRLFELLSCDHLEFISQQVERARHQERLARKRCCGVAEEQASASEPHTINTDFTFELFICATILIDNRDALLRCRDDVQLIQFTSSLQGTLDLNRTLRGAEEHLYNYCKRSAWGESLGGCCRARKHRHPHFLYQLRSFFF